MWCYTGTYRLIAGLILVSLLLASGATSQPQAISRECAETCFTLYRRPSTTWYEAYELCLNSGQRLLLITDDTVQNSIEKLQDVAQSEEGEVWVSGSRSLNDNWTDVVGKPFGGIYTSEALKSDICGAYNHGLDIVRAVQCVSSVTTNLRLTACQTPATNGVCPSGQSLVSGACMMIPGNVSRTWVQAQQVCASFGSTLAHTGVNSADFRQLVGDKLTGITLSLEVWLGVHRNPWVWVTGEHQNIEIPMSYYHWGRQEGGSVQGECMSIKLSDTERLWGDIPCIDELSYYICENSTQLPPEVPPTEPEVPPTEPAESTSGGLSQTNIIVIACVCVGVVLIIAVIVAIILVRKRDNRNKEMQDPITSQHSTQQYDYPVDTYHSNLQRVPQSGHTGDRELEPVDHDPYQSAQSVRSTKNAKKNKKSDKEADGPRYNNVFMMDE